MNIVDIINKKRMGEELTKEELEYTIKGFINGDIKDYQISSLLMAICLNDMTDEETSYLTEIMLNSGDKVDLSGVSKIKIDKHSTGSVGDKTTLILLPLVAACGVVAPKMSGRGLGFTGGTVDKFEAIPGFKSELSEEEFIKQVNEVGAADIAQTANLVPADKLLYALRDVTGTVESLPLIASSIMSKKLASGADKIVIDLKVGNGALIKNLEDARRLASIMVNIGKYHGKEVVCFLTDMNQPLGNAIGNSLEVKEAIEVLNNEGPKDIRDLVIVLGTAMVSMGLNISMKEANKLVLEKLRDGSAYKKFEEMVKYQGGNLEGLAISDKVISIKSQKSGFVRSIKTNELGEIVRKLGGGRYEKNDVIDPTVGIVLSVKKGDYLLEDEELVKVYINKKDISAQEIIDCFEIDDSSGGLNPLVYEMVK